MKTTLGGSSFQTRWNPKTKCVEYSAQPRRSWQCTQTGTGITGVTSWVPTEGVMLQLGHTDAWDSEGELPSLIRMIVEIEGDPFYAPLSFSGGLNTQNGTITWKAETKDGPVTVRIIPDMLRDMLMGEVEDRRSQPGQVLIRLEPYRTNVGVWGDEDTCFSTRTSRPSGMIKSVDEANGVVENACPDVFGDLMIITAVRMETGGQRIYNEALVKSKSSGRLTHFTIAAGVDRKSCADVHHDLLRRFTEAQTFSFDERVRENDNWWKTFWQKSYFEIGDSSPYAGLSMVWHTSRFFAAASMGGKFIPKFNGSIFLYGHDKRAWGGQYWQQNTRLQYWPLFKTGDIGYLPQYFNMFLNAIPYNRERVRTAYGHGGVIFSETAYFWGGIDPRYLKNKVPDSLYIKAHFTGSLELLYMMAEYYRYTGDAEFVRQKLLPLAEEIFEFYLAHYPVRDGRLFICNGHALETWWEADDPADQIAGLRAVTPLLTSLARTMGVKTPFSDRMLHVLPQFHFGRMNVDRANPVWNPPLPGKAILPISGTTHPKRENHEDPELYAVFPYSLYGVGLPDLDCGLATYEDRIQKDNHFGWCQQPVFAARLGLAQEAIDRFSTTYDLNTGLCGGMMSSVTDMIDCDERIPDCCGMDTTGVLAIAVNEMLMQDHTGTILKRPAWPEREPVAYKLHAATGPVEEEYKGV